MIRYNKIEALVLTILFFIGFTINAQTIVVGGSNWSIPITPITEAGMDYTGTFESATNQFLISATIPGLLGLLRTETVQVHFEENPLWNNNLTFDIRRTTSGGGGGICVLCSVSGGTTYQPITKNTTNFFNLNIPIGIGAKNFTNIPIQLKLSGTSVTLPVANYNARIVFTITN
ncbi:hypothetical protein NU10_13020 [Flavobacterium dauae]|uniref:hypothetical protein n=1 Tax=Flavobacterium dauae TaxID=1563479 RepID=UPI00101B45BF|nr:hypothetical protein [Flavobacterium dauae]WLD23612.1 hypothetical protein NU10_13020 [Flavobacterium dauae]